MALTAGLAAGVGGAFLGGYLLGSIPFGLLFTRAAGLGDVRQIGSGNIGATNVLRTGKKWIAAATLAGDLLKGTLAVMIAAYFGQAFAIAAAIGAFVGHVAPVWLGFKGGKGVATYIGVLLGLHWPAALVFCLIWLAVAFITRYSSLSALTAAAAVPAFFAVTSNWRLAATSLVLSAILAWRHKANIERLLRGKEARIGKS